MTAAATKRIFVCNNKRVTPTSCGLRLDASGAADQLTELLAERADTGTEYQVIKSKCLGRCQLGPVLGVFPDNAWYTYEDREDLGEIVSEHLENGRPVERLAIRRNTRSAA
ncbi:hypothetical protein [Kitasatospora sp. MAP5-34]|uniref:(2Fe-2S) ferredoxin domain-containing protein n=1 Tax=Kitasatospora sp. MAP5-34 TaxID=3035102 RepID=UPI0024766963|nr:hypothetical protein [Kitasatospora sp. MAP5-34]MDH6576657.1 (2Fe-2S) ferredoxin [Kitasatospora sp. MAP5-34]